MINLNFKLKKGDPSLVKHAKEEFRYAGWLDEEGNASEEMQGMIMANLLEVLEKIDSQGHSGFSINYFRHYLNNLIQYRPISNIEDSHDQWNHNPDGSAQHKREGSLFKDKEGVAYLTDGFIFESPDGCYSSNNSRRVVEFPLSPTEVEPIRIKVDKEDKIINPEERLLWESKSYRGLSMSYKEAFDL